MKLLKLFTCGIFIFGFQLSNYAGEFYTGLGVGNGDITIDTGSFPELPLADGTDGVLFGELFLGYEFDNNFLIELAYYNRETFFASTQLNDINLGLGYNFSSSSNTNFFVKGGLKFCDLNLRRGGGFSGILGPAIPLAFAQQNGEDLFVQIGADYAFKNKYKIGLAYDFSDTDFGQVNGAKVTFKWFPAK